MLLALNFPTSLNGLTDRIPTAAIHAID